MTATPKGLDTTPVVALFQAYLFGKLTKEELAFLDGLPSPTPEYLALREYNKGMEIARRFWAQDFELREYPNKELDRWAEKLLYGDGRISRMPLEFYLRHRRLDELIDTVWIHCSPGGSSFFQRFCLLLLTALKHYLLALDSPQSHVVELARIEARIKAIQVMARASRR